MANAFIECRCPILQLVCQGSCLNIVNHLNTTSTSQFHEMKHQMQFFTSGLTRKVWTYQKAVMDNQPKGEAGIWYDAQSLLIGYHSQLRKLCLRDEMYHSVDHPLNIPSPLLTLITQKQPLSTIIQHRLTIVRPSCSIAQTRFTHPVAIIWPH